MTAYPAGPYLAIFEYNATITNQVIVHEHKVNCAVMGNPAPGTPITGISFATRAGGNVLASTGIQNYWTQFRKGMSGTGVQLIQVTLWKVGESGEGRTYISSSSPSPAGGVAAGNPVAGHQTTLSFRTGIGGIMKLVYIETGDSGKNRVALTVNAAGSWHQAVAAYVMSSEGWIAGRGNSWPIAPLRLAQTYNEAVEEERHR